MVFRSGPTTARIEVLRIIAGGGDPLPLDATRSRGQIIFDLHRLGWIQAVDDKLELTEAGREVLEAVKLPKGR